MRAWLQLLPNRPGREPAVCRFEALRGANPRSAAAPCGPPWSPDHPGAKSTDACRSRSVPSAYGRGISSRWESGERPLFFQLSGLHDRPLRADRRLSLRRPMRTSIIGGHRKAGRWQPDAATPIHHDERPRRGHIGRAPVRVQPSAPYFVAATFAARSMVSATTPGWVMKTAWLPETVVMSAPIRFAMCNSMA